MLKNALKSTSMLALCTTLAVPPAMAQDATNIEGLEVCTEEGPFPCVLDGERIKNAKQYTRAMNDAAAEATEETAESAAEPAPGGDAAPGGDTVESEPAAEVAPEASADAEASAEVEVAPEEDKSLVEELADKLTGDDAESAEAEAAPAEEPVEAPAEDMAEDMAAEEPAPAPEEEMTAGDAIDENTQAETVQAPETEPAAEEDKSLVEELADKLTGDDGESAEAEVNAEAEAEMEANPEAQMTEAPEITDEPVEDEAPVAAAAVEADAEDETAEAMAADEDVVVEEVTEADARSSDEEFSTKVTAAAESTRQNNGNARTGNNNQREGFLNRELTDFEKLVLAGLGGVAVGTILANGDEIVSNSGDRIVVQNPDGTYQVLKNDDEILRQPGSVVSTKSFNDGSTRTVVERPNGVRIVTLRAADGTVLKRTRVLQDGTRVVLFDDTVAAQPVSQQDVASYDPVPVTEVSQADEDALREALMASMNARADRTFSLRQIRTYPQIRALAPVIEVDAITFDTGSSVIKASQADQLASLGIAIREVIADVPGAVFLIEGHTDAVGNAGYNLALSDRRAESVALALTEYFDVPPENLITQGYGESELKISTLDDERANRRANVRNITPLLQ